MSKVNRTLTLLSHYSSKDSEYHFGFMKTFIKKDEFSLLVNANGYNRHTAVLSAAAELFVNNESPSRNDLLHFEELCLRFLPKLNLRTKAEIAERLSRCVHLPQAVAMILAKEDISVAAPILRHHYSFQDEDLLVVLANGNQLHALAISSRKNLSDKILIALSQFQLPDFVSDQNETHDENQASQIDETQIESTHADQIQEEPASDDRAELTVITDSAEITDDYSEPAQSHGFTIGLDAFLANEPAYVLSQMQWIEEYTRNKDKGPATLLHEAYNRAEKALDFTKLARTKNAIAFGQKLAEECAISEADAKLILDDASGFALAICLKALALPKHVANEAFILLNPELGQDLNQVFLLEWFYTQISPAAARSLVENWHEENNSGMNVKNRNHQSVYDGKSYAEVRPERVTRRAVRSRIERDITHTPLRLVS